MQFNMDTAKKIKKKTQDPKKTQPENTFISKENKPKQTN